MSWVCTWCLVVGPSRCSFVSLIIWVVFACNEDLCGVLERLQVAVAITIWLNWGLMGWMAPHPRVLVLSVWHDWLIILYSFKRSRPPFIFDCVEPSFSWFPLLDLEIVAVLKLVYQEHLMVFFTFHHKAWVLALKLLYLVVDLRLFLCNAERFVLQFLMWVRHVSIVNVYNKFES